VFFIVKSDLAQNGSDYEYKFLNHNRKVSSRKSSVSRYRKQPQSRVVSINLGTEGIKITAGKDKGKPITVPNCGKSSVTVMRIVNGKDVQLGEFPWAVLIEANGVPICGGTILNERLNLSN
jgi:hypothetical protein